MAFADSGEYLAFSECWVDFRQVCAIIRFPTTEHTTLHWECSNRAWGGGLLGLL